MRSKKTWLAVVLQIIMAVTFIPSAAFAVDGEGAEQPDVSVTEDQNTEEGATEKDVEASGDVIGEGEEEGSFSLNVSALNDEDFLGSEENDPGFFYIYSEDGNEIVDYRWDGSELCDVELEWDMYLAIRQAGESTLMVTLDNDETVSIPVKIS